MATPVLLQSAFKAAGAVTSSTLAFPSNVSANSLLVGYILVSTTTGPPTLAVSDNLNGSYTSAVQGTESTTVDGGIFYLPNAAAGATTVTFSQTSGSAQLRILIQEWSNIVLTSPLDQTVSHQNGLGLNFLTGTTPSTTQNNELILACAFESGNTVPTSVPSGFTADANAQNKIYPSYQVGAAVGTYGGTYTMPTNEQGLGVVATFFASGGT